MAGWPCGGGGGGGGIVSGGCRCLVSPVSARAHWLLVFRRLLPASAQHVHVGGHDFGAPAVAAILCLPFAGLEAPFHIDLRPLAQVFGGDFTEAREHDDPVPFGAFLLFTALAIPPGFRGGDADIGDCIAAWHITGIGVAAEMTDEHYLVETSSHFCVSLFD